MAEYKEFTGKSLDEAMAAACAYFDLERGKLEIEIISDAKSGIFGLVGTKKAAIRARKANLEALSLKVGSEREENADKKSKNQNGKPRKEKTPKNENGRSENKNRQAKPAPAESAAPAAPVAPAASITEDVPASAAPAAEDAPKTGKSARGRQDSKGEKREGARQGARKDKRPEGKERNNKTRQEKTANPRPERNKQPRQDKPAPQHDGIEEKFPEVPLENMDQTLLEAEVLTAVDSMVRHIVGETGKEFEISGGKARVRIDSGEDSGLLIGRDGQTLSALQYLASCIVSRRMNASVRVQIDAGDYRSRQLEKLHNIALELAAKVKENGRPQSTRPMSAYLRRVVHMALQDDPDVQTHSKGEGSLKRVIIVPKKK